MFKVWATDGALWLLWFDKECDVWISFEILASWTNRANSLSANGDIKDPDSKIKKYLSRKIKWKENLFRISLKEKTLTPQK